MTGIQETQTATQRLTERFTEVMMRSAPTPALLIESGRGAYVTDVDGVEYLDFVAGIAVNSLGHAHPVFVEAVIRQLAAELDLTLALSGHRSVRELDRTAVA